MKKLSILCLFVLLLLTAYLPVNANTGSGGFPSGHLTYGVGAGSKSIADEAANTWSNSECDVVLTFTNEKDYYGSSAADIVTYFNYYDSTDGILGVIYKYKTYTGTSATLAGWDDRWVKATIYQYKDTKLNTHGKRMHTAVHEFGHALSIKHPSSKDISARMQQGVQESYLLLPYDRENCKVKWGIK